MVYQVRPPSFDQEFDPMNFDLSLTLDAPEPQNGQQGI